MKGRVFQINISSGGVPKLAIQQALLGKEGLKGDWQTNREHHGGIERAVCLYSLERITALQDEGHPIFPGSVGENLTLRGIDWDQLEAGVRLRFDSGAEIELTRPTTPCKSITASFRNGEISRIAHQHHPGWSRWYARVVCDGVIQTGDEVELIVSSG
ncbi:MAG: MOSC domain-containing protein [Chloroflexota bacterium]